MSVIDKITHKRLFTDVRHAHRPIGSEFTILATAKDGIITGQFSRSVRDGSPPPFGSYALVMSQKTSDQWWVHESEIGDLHPVVGDLVWLWDFEDTCYTQGVVGEVVTGDGATYYRVMTKETKSPISLEIDELMDTPEIEGYQIITKNRDGVFSGIKEYIPTSGTVIPDILDKCAFFETKADAEEFNNFIPWFDGVVAGVTTHEKHGIIPVFFLNEAGGQ